MIRLWVKWKQETQWCHMLSRKTRHRDDREDSIFTVKCVWIWKNMKLHPTHAAKWPELLRFYQWGLTMQKNQKKRQFWPGHFKKTQKVKVTWIQSCDFHLAVFSFDLWPRETVLATALDPSRWETTSLSVQTVLRSLTVRTLCTYACFVRVCNN